MSLSGLKSVLFGFNDIETHRIENVSPYALFGDSNGDYHGGESGFREGENSITATAYSENFARGSELAAATLNVTVLAGNATDASKELSPEAAFPNTAMLPEEFTLESNYPNPFNATTQIRFGLPERAQVELIVFDVLGQEVKTLVSESMPSGWHTVRFESGNLPSGHYFYRLNASEFVETGHMVLLR